MYLTTSHAFAIFSASVNLSEMFMWHLPAFLWWYQTKTINFNFLQQILIFEAFIFATKFDFWANWTDFQLGRVHWCMKLVCFTLLFCPIPTKLLVYMAMMWDVSRNIAPNWYGYSRSGLLRCCSRRFFLFVYYIVHFFFYSFLQLASLRGLE